MASGKKKKGKKPMPAKRGGGGGNAAPKPNPFEQTYQRKKFDMLGKKQKGGPKSIIQAREAGNNKVRRILHLKFVACLVSYILMTLVASC